MSSGLVVRIGGDVSDLNKALAEADFSLKGFAGSVVDVTSKLAAIGVAAAAAGAALGGVFVKAGLDAVDANSKLARSLDGSIDGLRAAQIAANEAGIENDALKETLQRLNAHLGEAQRNTGSAADALRVLGLNANELSKLDVDAKMAAISDRIHDLGMSSQQAADLLKELGIRNGEMVDLMRQGGDQFRAAAKDVKDYGLSISKVDGIKVEQANDAIERMGRVVEAVRNQLAIAFAPILKGIADKFNDMTKANHGFAEQARDFAEGTVKAFGKIADVVRGLHVVFKGLELIGVAAFAAILTALDAVMHGFTMFADALNAPLNGIIKILNALGANIEEVPSLDSSPFMQSIDAVADGARNKVVEIRQELVDLAEQPMPSAQVDAFFANLKKKGQEAAEAAANVKPSANNFQSDDEQARKEEERQLAALEQYRESLRSKLDNLMEYGMTAEQLENDHYEKQQVMLSEALATQLITVEQAQKTMAALEERHMVNVSNIRHTGYAALNKFTKMTYTQQAQTIFGSLTDITSGVAQHNKTMFELNKVAGIANAVVSAYEGISLTLGSYPFPLSVIMAAAQAAAAFAQIQAIRSTSFGSGGGAAPSLSGSTSAPPVSPVSGGTGAASPSNGTLMVQGINSDSIFTGAMVRDLAQRLADHQRDGGEVIFQ
jgi:flagellar biosynthesis chaperone FliJ